MWVLQFHCPENFDLTFTFKKKQDIARLVLQLMVLDDLGLISYILKHLSAGLFGASAVIRIYRSA